jgi:hypothetical protein
LSVQVHKLPNGDVQLGAEIEGVFISFASHSAGRLAQYVQRGRDLKERAENGDELARDQIGKPIEAGESSSKSVSKMTSDELDEYASSQGIADFPSSGNKAEKVAAIEAHEGSPGEDA